MQFIDRLKRVTDKNDFRFRIRWKKKEKKRKKKKWRQAEKEFVSTWNEKSRHFTQFGLLFCRRNNSGRRMVTQYGRPYAEGRFEPTDNYKGCYGAFGGRGELKFNGGARGYIRKVPTSEGSQSARNFGGIRTYLSARLFNEHVAFSFVRFTRGTFRPHNYIQIHNRVFVREEWTFEKKKKKNKEEVIQWVNTI